MGLSRGPAALLLGMVLVLAFLTRGIALLFLPPALAWIDLDSRPARARLSAGVGMALGAVLLGACLFLLQSDLGVFGGRVRRENLGVHGILLVIFSLPFLASWWMRRRAVSRSRSREPHGREEVAP